MTIKRLLVQIALVLLLVGCAVTGGVVPHLATDAVADTASAQRTAAWFEAHRYRPTLLRTFIQRMPKGGDLHTHASGAVYAESYIAWAAAEDLCVVRATGAITNQPCTAADGKVSIRRHTMTARSTAPLLMRYRRVIWRSLAAPATISSSPPLRGSVGALRVTRWRSL